MAIALCDQSLQLGSVMLMALGGLYARLYASSHGSFDDLPGEGERRADREVMMT